MKSDLLKLVQIAARDVMSEMYARNIFETSWEDIEKVESKTRMTIPNKLFQQSVTIHKEIGLERSEAISLLNCFNNQYQINKELAWSA